ncbi:MAG: hypothetical protein OXE80_00155, partial [Gammaproteobacteria bacterium]|nr:hypothetical protein [Gammaproteobacteria bacterium]
AMKKPNITARARKIVPYCAMISGMALPASVDLETVLKMGSGQSFGPAVLNHRYPGPAIAEPRIFMTIL